MINSRQGDKLKIRRVNPLHPRAKRLADMGFIKDAEVEMIRVGSPCVIRLGVIILGLGKEYQESIECLVM